MSKPPGNQQCSLLHDCFGNPSYTPLAESTLLQLSVGTAQEESVGLDSKLMIHNIPTHWDMQHAWDVEIGNSNFSQSEPPENVVARAQVHS